jgi:hypothetical protein
MQGESVREVGLMHYALNNPQKDPLSLLTFGLLGDGALPMPIAPVADSCRWRVRCPFSVPETVRRLETVIRLHQDSRLLARIDQAETVAATGGSAQ